MSVALFSNSSPMLIGSNLTEPADWSTELAFRNIFVFSRPWISGSTSGAWSDGRTVAVDANGWPTSLLAGQIARTLFYTFDNSYPRPTGTYKVAYEGSGELNYGQAARLISRSPSVDTIAVSAGGAIEIDLVATAVANPLRNINVIASDDSENTSRQFRKAFLDSLAGYKLLRFMEWQATNGSRQVNWSDRRLPANAHWTTSINGAAEGGGTGIPLELMIDLCNTLNVAPWFCIPHQASDAYVQAMAELIADKLSSNLPVAFEFSNEVWNGIMPQSAYAANLGKAFGEVPANQPTWGTTPFQWQMAWYARRATQCFKLIEKIIPPNRLARILSSQCGNPWVSAWILGFEDTRQHVDALAIAPYIGDGITSAVDLTDLFAQMNAALKNIMSNLIPGHRLAAQGLPIVCYECGDGTPTNTSNPALAALVAGAAADPRMGSIYQSFFQQLQTAGVRAAVHYINTQQSNVAANQPGFGAQYYLGQNPTTPKLAALRSLPGMKAGS